MTTERQEKFHSKKSHKDPTEQCHWCRVERMKCEQKEYRFDDRIEAAIELVKVNLQRRARGRDRLNFYQCIWCDRWHFTTPPQRGKAKREQGLQRHEAYIRELERRG